MVTVLKSLLLHCSKLPNMILDGDLIRDYLTFRESNHDNIIMYYWNQDSLLNDIPKIRKMVWKNFAECDDIQITENTRNPHFARFEALSDQTSYGTVTLVLTNKPIPNQIGNIIGYSVRIVKPEQQIVWLLDRLQSNDPYCAEHFPHLGWLTLSSNIELLSEYAKREGVKEFEFDDILVWHQIKTIYDEMKAQYYTLRDIPWNDEEFKNLIKSWISATFEIKEEVTV